MTCSERKVNEIGKRKTTQIVRECDAYRYDDSSARYSVCKDVDQRIVGSANVSRGWNLVAGGNQDEFLVLQTW